MHCTKPRVRRSPCNVRRRTCATIALVAIASCWSPAATLADGDPASDVLASQPLFIPQDAGARVQEQTQLSALLAAAERRGLPIRVALIASADDLGAVSALWRQPQSYARFLGQELALLFHGPLLVAMPNGFGFYRPDHAVARERAALAGIRVTNGDLAAATITAIERVATVSGHALPIEVAAAKPAAGSDNTVEWLVFALGAALVALSWLASLRARPTQFRGPG